MFCAFRIFITKIKRILRVWMTNFNRKLFPFPASLVCLAALLTLVHGRMEEQIEYQMRRYDMVRE